MDENRQQTHNSEVLQVYFHYINILVNIPEVHVKNLLLRVSTLDFGVEPEFMEQKIRLNTNQF